VHRFEPGDELRQVFGGFAGSSPASASFFLLAYTTPKVPMVNGTLKYWPGLIRLPPFRLQRTLIARVGDERGVRGSLHETGLPRGVRVRGQVGEDAGTTEDEVLSSGVDFEDVGQVPGLRRGLDLDL